MTAIRNQKYDTKMAIYELLDQYLAEHPEEVAEIAKGLAQNIASRMTLAELIQWRNRINGAVSKNKSHPAHQNQGGLTC